MKRLLWTVASLAILAAAAGQALAQPVPIVFDTDMGNDVDDALALGLIHALQSRGECRLLAVTLTKCEPLAATFTDAVNTFYGRGNVPVGLVRNGPTPGPGRFLKLAEERDGEKLRYPRGLQDGNDAPNATVLLRKVLAGQADKSVVFVQVGFSTNLARLLDSPADDISPLSGRDLVAKKGKLLAIMAGSFQPIHGKRHLEYNVIKDIPAAKTLVTQWPTPILWSGYEIGIAIPYPAVSIEQDYDYVAHHPVAEAYCLYMPPPHNRPTWDLTCVLQVVRPDRGYFGISQPGRVTIADDGGTQFEADPNGLHRYLTVDANQCTKITEAFVNLCSQPPCAGPLDDDGKESK